MDINKRKTILYSLGAKGSNIDELLDYTSNMFLPCGQIENDDFLEKWEPVLQTAQKDGAGAAINRHLVKAEFAVDFISPETIHIELFHSIGGTIPVITSENSADFESMVRNIVYRGKEAADISEMGASFAFGKFNRFMILSNKSYSNVSAAHMGLSEAEWSEKSLLIRKHHECLHYYTKRYFGSSRNNLHDELIADFYGIYSAFGEYKADWFLRFIGVLQEDDHIGGRIKIYTKDLHRSSLPVIRKIATRAANGIEHWTKTDEFLRMSEPERINYLCGKALLEYVD